MSVRIRVLTDGKIGDDVQCQAVANALSSDVEKCVIAPRPVWSLVAPWGPPDPRDVARAAQPPWPDIVIASGRRAIPCGRAIKSASGGRTKLVILKDPRFGRAAVDFIWAPTHDGVSGENVLTTDTSPHGLRGMISAARAREDSALARGGGALLGVCLGGPSGGAIYDETSALDLARRLLAAGADYDRVFITPSRRTPDEFIRTLRESLGQTATIWDGSAENPYIDMLAHARTLIVAGDSHNMVSEALSTASGVYVWRPRGLGGKLARFLDAMAARGALREFTNAAPTFERAPVDATETIAAEIRQRFNL